MAPPHVVVGTPRGSRAKLAFEPKLRDVRDLPRRAVEELEKFFQATDALQPKDLQFLGWRGPAQALKQSRTARASAAPRA